MAAASSRGSALRKRLLALGVSTVLVLVLAEVALPLIGFNDRAFTRPDPLLGYSLIPGLSQRRNLEGEALNFGVAGYSTAQELLM